MGKGRRQERLSGNGRIQVYIFILHIFFISFTDGVSIRMRKQAKKVSAGQPFEGMSAIVHNTILAGPIASAQSKAVTRFVVAQRALDRLRESESDTRDLMNEICDCYQVGDMEVRDEVEVEKGLLEDSDDDGASLYYSFPDDDNYQDI